MRKADKKSYSKEFKAQVISYALTHTLTQTKKEFNVSEGTVSRWLQNEGTPKRTATQPQTLSYRVGRVKRYLLKKHGYLSLSVKQAFDEIGTFRNGTELGNALNTPRLPTLSIGDIARYIVLYT